MNLLYDISKYLENINTDSLCNLLLYDPRQPLLFNATLSATIPRRNQRRETHPSHLPNI